MKRALAAMAPRVGMGHRVRTGVGAVAASALAAALVLTAAPASAASTTTSITQQSCASEGGTFTRAKGVKTCTSGPSSIRYTSPSQLYDAAAYGPFDNPSLPADGYAAEWRYAEGYRDTVVQTQKGGGAVVTTTTSVLVYRATTDQTCFSLTYYPPLNAYGYGSAFTVQCDILGLYPATIDLRG